MVGVITGSLAGAIGYDLVLAGAGINSSGVQSVNFDTLGDGDLEDIPNVEEADIFNKGKEVYDNFDIEKAYVKPKHVGSNGGNGAKFVGDSKSASELILKDAMKNGNVVDIVDNGLTSAGNQSYQIVIDAGKAVGTKGETYIKIVLSEDGGMLSAYPINWP